MNRTWALVVSAAFFLITSAAHSQDSDAIRAKLDKAKGSKSEWSVRDGTLIGRGALGYLTTERNDFENFRLRVEAMIGYGGDSGVCFRVQNKQVTVAYEAQIGNRPNMPKTGTLVAFVGTGHEILAAAAEAIPPGKWLTVEVLADGDHITIWVDGKQTADYQNKNKLYSSGPIALQQNGTAANVSFRNVQIKELPAK